MPNRRPARARAAFTAALLAGAATPAFAQDARPQASANQPAPADGNEALNPPSDAIVVTGQRAAEARAVDAKRESNRVQDVISSTDVGRLPDQNVAEAVRRAPGVSVANDQGEGRYVIIRGTDPNLANVTLNGQAAAAPEPDGRQVKLDDIPSSLIGSVEIIKTLTPDLDANAIAGQVNINTLSAFDRRGTFAYARGAIGVQDLSGHNPYEFDATVGSRLAGDTLGIVLSGNYSRRPIESENFQGSANWNILGGQDLPDDFRLRDYNLVRERYGLVANVDYRPSDNAQLYLRTLYSVFKDNETRDQFRIELPGLRTSTTGTGIFGQSGDIAQFTGGRGTRFVRRRQENDSTVTVQGGGRFRFGNDILLRLEGAWSHALKKDPLRSEFQFRSGNSLTAGLSGTIDLSRPLFLVDPFGTPGRAYDPTFYPARQVNYDRRRASEELIQGRVDLEIPLGMGEGSTFQVGGKLTLRDKDNARDFQQFDLNGFNLSVAARDDGLFLYNGRYRFGPRVDYDAAQAYITANPARAVLNVAGTVGNSLVNDYIVGEDVYAGYAMATLRFGRVTLVPGVRVEHTEGTYQGKTITATSTATQGFNVSGSNSYTDVFPGVNLRIDVNDNLVLRAAAVTAIGRPNYDDLAPYVQVDAGANTVSQGNPTLDPLRSRNFDLSAEYYFANRGVLSVAAFYRDIDNPIFAYGLTGQNGTFGGVALTNAVVTQPINGEKSEIYGVEANLQLPLTFLPHPLDGFGVNLNYTRTGGSTSGIPGRLADADNYLQSRSVASAQLYYEKDRVALRVAYSYRSRFLDTVGANPSLDQYTAGNGQIDARASFAILPQAVVFVEGTNLNDEPWRRYLAVPNRVIENERYGYTARMGLQLAF